MELYGGQKANSRFMPLYDNSCRVIYISLCCGIHTYLHFSKLIPHMLYVDVCTNPCRRINKLMPWYALTHVIKYTN